LLPLITGSSVDFLGGHADAQIKLVLKDETQRNPTLDRRWLARRRPKADHRRRNHQQALQHQMVLEDGLAASIAAFPKLSQQYRPSKPVGRCLRKALGDVVVKRRQFT